MVRKCEELGISAKRCKIVGPESERTIILGIEFNSDGVLRSDAEKLKTLLGFTHQYVLLRRWKKRTLERLLETWAWTVQLKRCIYSVFEKVYWALEQDPDSDSVTPIRAIRNEFRLICRLHMFIRADLLRPFSTTVICTDASNTAGRVVYTRTSASTATELSQQPIDTYREWIRKQEWATSICH